MQVMVPPEHPISLPPAAPPSLGNPFVPNQTLGRYRILRDLGVGGMAQVFLASREGPDGFAKPYVIKRILPEYSHDETFANMFVIEAKVAAMLDHPNIAHVFELEKEHGYYYLVQEYVLGTSLLKLMGAAAKQRVPVGAHVAIEVGLSVARALAYAHELTLPDGRRMDLVHRDISPGNILISRDGAVKLIDFGVVKTSLTGSGSAIVNGKWSYMSPEQIRGEAVDGRSDIFSLGIVMYEVLTGRRLFRGDSVNATASRVVTAPILDLGLIVPGIAPNLSRVVMKMLKRDLAARYQTAAELVADPGSAARAAVRFDTRGTPGRAGACAVSRRGRQPGGGWLLRYRAVHTGVRDAREHTVDHDHRRGAGHENALGGLPRRRRGGWGFGLGAKRRELLGGLPASALDASSASATNRVPLRLVLGIVAACAAASLIVWLVVL